ncbi:putative Cell wall-associated hydrolase [Candidatus Terasakiella magnetica]|nr:putative Cell wall-associated hydrolase [Candidatus Terasakiella magnetica]
MSDHLQVGNLSPRIQCVAGAGQSAFSYSFPIPTAADMAVWVGTVLQSPAAYTVTGAGLSTGGTVVFASPPATGAVVTLVRRLLIQRVSDFPQNSGFLPKPLNDELDFQTMAIQQVAEDAGRAVKRALTSTNNADLTLPEPSPGKAIKWNASAAGLENSCADVDTVLAGATGQANAASISATAALSSQNVASTAAAAAAVSRGACDADAAATAADRIAVHADRVASDADAVSTALDRSAVHADRIACDADAAATAADRTAVHADRVACDADAIATAADRIAVHADRVAADTAAASALASAASASASAGGGAIRISTSDTTADYLAASLVAGGNIALSVNNAGGNETLTIAVTGLGSAAALAADTDGALTANSDTKVATQKAVKTYAAGKAVENVFTKQQSGTVFSLTDGASIAWDLSTGQTAQVTLGGNRTLAAPTSQVAGTYYALRVAQDGSGSRTLAYNAAFKGVSAATLSTAANAVDHLVFRSNGTVLELVGFKTNVGA